MPIYEYRCRLCGYEYEVRQKMSEENLTRCPECTEEGLDKLISRSSFQLKGTGWYQTDFKNPPKAEALKKEAPKTESKPETPAPVKPAEKAGSKE